ncbi:hypothetical protein ACOME3_003289 [Neoechinorhynchus agilis]
MDKLLKTGLGMMSSKKSNHNGPRGVQGIAYKAAFNYFDKDKSGYIEFYELMGALDRLGLHFGESVVRQVFNLIDSNHNGKIDYSEFCRLITLLKGQNQNVNRSYY